MMKYFILEFYQYYYLKKKLTSKGKQFKDYHNNNLRIINLLL